MMFRSCFLTSCLLYDLVAIEEKRILLHSETDILQRITLLEQEVLSLKQENTALKTSKLDTANLDAGSVYILWGRTTCNANGTTLVYKGYMAGGHFYQKGGGNTYQCLPHDVEWDFFETAIPGAELWGTEYEMIENTIGQGSLDNDAPCSVCRTPRSTKLMIPGRKTCFLGWTLEYHGYLGAHLIGTGRLATNFVCVDSQVEKLDRGATNDNQAVVQNVAAKCGSLPCPPYVDGRQLTCVVCSK